MTKRTQFGWMTAAALAAVVALILLAVFARSPAERAEAAMRRHFKDGWAGTNAAHRIVRELPTDQALETLSALLRAPESRWLPRYQKTVAIFPDAVRRILPRPASAGPVQMCSYVWLGEALGRTNASVRPLLPLLRERPDLFWNVVTEPLIRHLNAHPDEIDLLLPLLRSDEPRVVNVVAHLVSLSDARGVSEPEFRRLLPLAPDDRVAHFANALARVTRTPESTSDWLWQLAETETPARWEQIRSATEMLEFRVRRPPEFFRSRLASTNRVVRLAALHALSLQSSKSAPHFSALKSLAQSADPEERGLALKAIQVIALSAQRDPVMRAEAARLVFAEGDPPLRSMLAGQMGSTRFPFPIALELLEPLLGDGSPDLRAGAVAGLGGYPEEVARLRPLLEPLLRDAETSVRVAATNALLRAR